MSRTLVLSAHRGQLDRRIVAEVNALAQSGREVTLVTVPAVIPHACLDPRVRVVVTEGRASAAAGRIKRLIASLPGPLYRAAESAWHLSPFRRDPPDRNHLLKAVGDAKFDFIHCHDLDTLPVGVELRAKRLPQARLIYDSHELFPFQLKNPAFQRRWHRIEKAYIKEADLVIAVNESIARVLGRFYGIGKPEVIYSSCDRFENNNGSPLGEKEFLEHFHAADGSFRVIFQGNLTPGRNLDRLVAAFGLLGSSTALFLLGAGPLEAGLKRQCQKDGIPNVFFGPWVPQEVLLHYVSRANLGVIPYPGKGIPNNRYCTPNKLFEFIEVEIPVCANDLPELRRIVKGSGIGDVYPMDTPQAIAHAIEACRSRCVRGEFALAARQAARETFGWRRQGQKLVELYERMEA